MGGKRAIVALAVLGLFLGACGAGQEALGQPPGRQSGDRAADFALTVYRSPAHAGGSAVRLSDLLAQGRPVVLNFWAGQCPPCRAEMPDFERVYQRFKDRVLVVGADIGPHIGLGSTQDGQALLAQLGITYPTGFANDGAVLEAYQVLGMPYTVFLTSGGAVHRSHTGILNERQMTQFVEELLKQ